MALPSFRPPSFAFPSSVKSSPPVPVEKKKVDLGIKIGRIRSMKDTYGFIQCDEDKAFDAILFPIGEVEDSVPLHAGYKVRFHLFRRETGQYKVKEVAFLKDQILSEEAFDDFLQQNLLLSSTEQMLLNITNFLYPWSHMLSRFPLAFTRIGGIIQLTTRQGLRDTLLQERYRLLLSCFVRSNFITQPENFESYLKDLLNRLKDLSQSDNASEEAYESSFAELRRCVAFCFELVSLFPLIEMKESLREILAATNEFLESGNEEEGKEALDYVLDVVCPPGERHHLRQIREENESNHWTVPLYPSLDELKQLSGGEVTLPKHKPVGKFESDKQYLNTLFFLLRADCFGPIAEGLRQLQHSTSSHNSLFPPNTNQKMTPGIRNESADTQLRLYTKIKFEGVYFRPGGQGICHCVSFQLGGGQSPSSFDWEQSSRLAYGNLLCLTIDGFKDTLFWAVVAQRNVDFLKRGLLLIQFRPGDAEALQQLLNPNLAKLDEDEDEEEDEEETEEKIEKKKQEEKERKEERDKIDVVMAETATFFMAYEPVLRCLQRIKVLSHKHNPTNPSSPSSPVPFSEYLVRAEGNQEGPSYIHPSHRDRVLSDVQNLPFHQRLEASQFEALRHSLSCRVALIQGPPGTGKTFTARKILQSLLNVLNIRRRAPTPSVNPNNKLGLGLNQRKEELEKDLKDIQRKISEKYSQSEAQREKAMKSSEMRDSAHHEIKTLTEQARHIKEEKADLAAFIDVQKTLRDQHQARRSEEGRAAADASHAKMVASIEKRDSLSKELNMIYESKDHWKAEADKLHNAYLSARSDQDRLHKEITDLKTQLETRERALSQLHRLSGPSSSLSPRSQMPAETSSEPFEEGPVLVLTYKNHSLDEFLEGCLPFCENLVRVGGRSKNKKLEKYNLKELVKTQREKPPATNEEFLFKNASSSVRRKLDSLKKVIRKLQGVDEDDLLDDDDDIKDKQTPSSSNRGGRQPLSNPHHVQKTNPDVEKRKRFENFLNKLAPEAQISESASGAGESDDGGGGDLWDTLEELEEPHNERLIDTDFGFDAEEEDLSLFVRIKKVDEQMKKEPHKDTHNKEKDNDKDKSNDEKDKDTKEEDVVNEFDEEFFVSGDFSDKEKYYGYLRACNSYQLHARDLKQIYDQRRLSVLRGAQIVGMTTTGCAIYQDLIRALAPKIIFVEEAAEILEPQLVACLTSSVEHVILIGDHLQLRPSVSWHRLTLENSLDISLFERLVNNSLAHPSSSLPHVTLQEQRRMRKEIASLVSHIYPLLRSHPSVEDRYLKLDLPQSQSSKNQKGKPKPKNNNNRNSIPFRGDEEAARKAEGYVKHVAGARKNLFLIDHSYSEQPSTRLRSLCNPNEAKLILSAATHLVRSGVPATSIAILSTYRGQLLLLRDLVRRAGGKLASGVRLHTVDGFQGDESDVVLLSLVRNNSNSGLGFLARTNRVCVALTRARFGLYIFGNSSVLRSSRAWTPILENLKNLGAIGTDFPYAPLEQDNKFPDRDRDRDRDNRGRYRDFGGRGGSRYRN